MEIKHFFDQETFTLTYVILDKTTKDAVIIDPVWNYDSASVTTNTRSIDLLQDFLKERKLKVHYVLETHAHADHLSGAHELVTKHLPEAKIGIGEGITIVQETFKSVLNLPKAFKTDGSQFHQLFKDNDLVVAGSLKFKVLSTPGHTPACVTYLFEDAVFTGDALFMPDSGTGRCDFPHGDATKLYHSIANRLYDLPDSTRVFVGHDYQPGSRQLEFETTIGDSKKNNIHIDSTTKGTDFVSFRKSRDATLAAPKLLFPSIQVNIAAGKLPEAESNGQIYLKLPITAKK